MTSEMKAAPITAPQKILIGGVVMLLIMGISVSALSGKTRSIAPVAAEIPVAAKSTLTHASVDTAGRSEDPILTRTDPNKAVQSLSANWLLAKQLSRQQETLKALHEANESGDIKGTCSRILLARSVELDRAINEVSNGNFSIEDKEKMLKPLQEDKEWADSSYAQFQALP